MFQYFIKEHFALFDQNITQTEVNSSMATDKLEI
jgi:hypothetical protein